MNEKSANDARKRWRLRWLTLGEAIAIAALVISGLGLWHELTKPNEKPVVVEKSAPIPLTLRGQVHDEGRSLEIGPVEDGHALQSLTITVGASKIELGSDGELAARAVEKALGQSDEDDESTYRLRVGADARYVESGADKTATGSYVLSYRWEGGGLLGGRSLRLVSLTR